MGIFLAFALPLLGLSLAGARGVVPAPVGLLAIAGFFCCLAFAIILGYRSRRIAIEERQRGSATTMLVMMASMLGQEDDATLEKIAAKGGPAGDAASMLLQNRHSSKSEE